MSSHGTDRHPVNLFNSLSTKLDMLIMSNGLDFFKYKVSEGASLELANVFWQILIFKI